MEVPGIMESAVRKLSTRERAYARARLCFGAKSSAQLVAPEAQCELCAADEHQPQSDEDHALKGATGGGAGNAAGSATTIIVNTAEGGSKEFDATSVPTVADLAVAVTSWLDVGGVDIFVADDTSDDGDGENDSLAAGTAVTGGRVYFAVQSKTKAEVEAEARAKAEVAAAAAAAAARYSYNPYAKPIFGHRLF